jgi:integral membrane protein (TIGR01906 family)
MREAIFGVAFLVAAIGASADVWGYDWFNYYASFARDAQLERETFHLRDGDRRIPLGVILQVDRATRGYVVCGCFRGDNLYTMRVLFDENEIAHLEDVRRVFEGVQRAAMLGGVIAVILALALPPARVRRALFVAASCVVVFGLVAAVAFEPLFLAFHEIFFQQGNFLFDPTRENLTLVYPEDYWLGVTLRLGATVFAICLLVGGLLTLRIRSNAAVRANVETPR